MATSIEEKREAIKLATIDSAIALCLALTINASILILAAATFHRAGRIDVAELDQAHAFLAPLLGSTLAPTLFAIALLCCGLNSTITATLSGQIVMEGFLNLRIAPWLRRLMTRVIAIVPAVVVTIWAGEKATGQLLILSQVVLSLQLPFAVVPLVMFTASRRKMGAVRGAALADRAGGADGGGDHRAERETGVRLWARLRVAQSGRANSVIARRRLVRSGIQAD